MIRRRRRKQEKAVNNPSDVEATFFQGIRKQKKNYDCGIKDDDDDDDDDDGYDDDGYDNDDADDNDDGSGGV